MTNAESSIKLHPVKAIESMVALFSTDLSTSKKGKLRQDFFFSCCGEQSLHF